VRVREHELGGLEHDWEDVPLVRAGGTQRKASKVFSPRNKRKIMLLFSWKMYKLLMLVQK
jgi:hypothetical protein